jgi:hypothetical protein
VVALLAARLAVRGGVDPTRLVIAAAALAGWSALVALAYRRVRAADRDTSTAIMPLTGALVAGYGLIGGALVAVSGP